MNCMVFFGTKNAVAIGLLGKDASSVILDLQFLDYF